MNHQPEMVLLDKHIGIINIMIPVLPIACDSMDYNPQAPLSVGFPRQEYWSALHFLLQRDLPNPGIKPASPALSGANTAPPGKPSNSLPTNTML